MGARANVLTPGVGTAPLGAAVESLGGAGPPECGVRGGDAGTGGCPTGVLTAPKTARRRGVPRKRNEVTDLTLNHTTSGTAGSIHPRSRPFYDCAIIL